MTSDETLRAAGRAIAGGVDPAPFLAAFDQPQLRALADAVEAALALRGLGTRARGVLEREGLNPDDPKAAAAALCCGVCLFIRRGVGDVTRKELLTWLKAHGVPLRDRHPRDPNQPYLTLAPDDA